VNIGFNLPGLLLNDVIRPDQKAFRPERWLDSNPQQMREMDRVMELFFGWGSTRCLGIRMANTNQSKFFVEVSNLAYAEFWVVLILNLLASILPCL
jgi:Cytochrome P450